jgi:hypothetical protein
MSRNDERAIASIVEEISRYLAESSAAADSVDGIQRSWLPPELRATPLPLVEFALGRLISEGIISSVTTKDGKVIYSRRRGRAGGDSTKDAP